MSRTDVRRYAITAAVLTGAATAVVGGGLIGISADPEPQRAYKFTALPMPEDITAWGWAMALLVIATVPIAQHLAVIVAWAWQPIAAARIEREAPLLDDYGRTVAEIRTGWQPVLGGAR